ncbi:DNA primase [Betaproteobacteria bacterium]|nr:DNA primase [Betaproteobacteria bacterium]GHU22637.1 DNA primase [Betaproteobacteria bacterium]
MIPSSFIQDLLARVDIVDVIERFYGPLKKSGVDYYARCPFHSEKSASFSVSPTKQFYYCFGCGAHGSAIRFLMEYSSFSYPEAVEELARSIGMQVPQEGRTFKPAEDHQDLLGLTSTAAKFYQETLKTSPAAIDYLKQRGLSGAIAARFGIGYAPDGWQPLQKVFPDYQHKQLLSAGLVIDDEQGRRHDRFRHRIMFPIHDRRGRIIAFGGRVLDDSKPKYLNSPETPLFEKGHELYGLFLAQKAIRDTGFALVVEGYMDVVALAQFGVENVVAALGTATTPHHIKALLRQTNRIVFCFDGDEAGRRAAWRAQENALDALRDDVTLAFLFLPPEHDPDTFVRSEGADAFRTAAAQATPLVSFLLNTLKERCDPASAEGRARLIHEAKPLITRIPADAAAVLRLQLAKALAEVSHLSQAEVEHSCGLAPAPRHQPPANPDFRGNTFRDQAPRRTAPRQPPSSTIAKLLWLVLQHPAFAARLPLGLIPDNSAEGRALIAIIDLVEVGEPVDNLGALIERFRDTPHSQTLSNMATALADTEFDDANVERLFEDTLKKLHADALTHEIDTLTESAKIGALSALDRRRLNELIMEKQSLSTHIKTGNL